MNISRTTTVSEISSLKEILPEEFDTYTVWEISRRIGRTKVKDRTELDDLLEENGYILITGPFPQHFTEGGNEANFQYEVQRTAEGRELQQALQKYRFT